MEYVLVQDRGVKKLFMWLPDHDQVVRVCHVAREAGVLDAPIRDWSGRLVAPHDGERFLEAAFDYFTLHGLDLQWVNMGRCGLDQVDILGIES